MDNQFQFKIRRLAKPSFNMNRLLRWLLVLALLVAAGGVALFLFSRSSFSPGRVDFEIKAPEEIASGDKVIYSVEYRNNNEKAVKDLHLTFFYPPEAVDIRDGQLTVLQTESVKLDDLEPGQENKIEFPVYLVGGRGDTKKARAVLSFYGEDMPSVFKKETTAATRVSSLAVALTLVAPPKAIPDQTVTYLLDYRNESSEDLADLRFRFAYPNGFTPNKFSPNDFSAKDTLDLKSLKTGEGERISISGILQGAEKDTKTISVVLQRKTDGLYIDFERSSQETVLSTPPLTAQVLVNEQTDYSAKLADNLEYQIKFTNNTDQDIFGLTASAKLEGTMFDFNTVETNGTFDNSTRLVSWNASVSPLLNQLAPGQTGAVYFKVKVKDSFPSSGTGVKDSVIKITAKTETSELSAESELVTKIVEALTPSPEVIP